MLCINYRQKDFADAVKKSLSEGESVQITLDAGYKARALAKHFPHLVGTAATSAPFFATFYRQLVLVKFLVVFAESAECGKYGYRITEHLDNSVVVDFEII